MIPDFGFKLPNCGGVLCPPEWARPETVEQLAKDAVGAGFTSLWLHDHVLTPDELKHLPQPEFLEPVVVAVRLAALVPTVRIGVATIVLPLREPVGLAKQLATAARFFPGRIIAGIGSGRYRSEFRSFGASTYDARGKVMDEYVRLMRALFSEASVTTSGTYRSLAGAEMYPKPRPGELELWVAANGPAGIGRAARLGDGWIAAAMPVAEFAAAADTYRAAAMRSARPAGAMALSVTIDPNDAGGRGDTQKLHRHANAIHGNALQVAAELERYRAAGVTHFLISFSAATLGEVREKMRWFAAEVRPALAVAA